MNEHCVLTFTFVYIFQGRVIALDKIPIKAERIVKTIDRWSQTCVECYAFDSTKSVDEKSGKYKL